MSEGLTAFHFQLLILSSTSGFSKRVFSSSTWYELCYCVTLGDDAQNGSEDE